MTDRFEVPDFLTSKISPCPLTGCWWWVGAVDAEGYGHVTINGKTQRAHRAVLVAVGRPVPRNLTTDHLCRNRSCVNPAHLEAVSNKDNVLRGAGPTAQNARSTHCTRGHSDWRVIRNGPRKGKRVCRRCATARVVAAYHRKNPNATYYKSRAFND